MFYMLGIACVHLLLVSIHGSWVLNVNIIRLIYIILRGCVAMLAQVLLTPIKLIVSEWWCHKLLLFGDLIRLLVLISAREMLGLMSYNVWRIALKSDWFSDWGHFLRALWLDLVLKLNILRILVLLLPLRWWVVLFTYRRALIRLLFFLCLSWLMLRLLDSWTGQWITLVHPSSINMRGLLLSFFIKLIVPYFSLYCTQLLLSRTFFLLLLLHFLF